MNWTKFDVIIGNKLELGRSAQMLLRWVGYIQFRIGYAFTLSHACMAFTSRADMTVRQQIFYSPHIPACNYDHLQ